MSILDDIDRMEQLTGQADLEKSSVNQHRLSNEDIDAAFIDFNEALQSINPEQAPERTILRTLGDVGISTAKGVVGAGEAAVGLANIPTFGYAGKGLEAIGYDPKGLHKLLASGYSDAQKAANEKVEAAEGFVDTAGTMIKNPSTIGHAVVESLPSSIAGGYIGRGLLKAGTKYLPKAIEAMGKYAPVIAGASGEGIVGAGSAAERTRQETASGTLTGKQVALSGASGFGTGAFALAGGAVAKKLGFADLETMIASGNFKKNSEGIIKSIIGGGISEGMFEEMPQSAQEQIFANAALDKPLMEGVGKSAAAGALTGFAMGGTVNAITTGKKQKELSADEKQLNKQVDNIFSFGEEKVNTTLQTLQENVAKNSELLNNQEALDKYAIDANIDPDILIKQLVDDNIKTTLLINGIQKRFVDQQVSKDQEDANLSPEEKQVLEIQNRIKTQREEAALNINEQINGINEQLRNLRQQAAQEQDAEKRNGIYENVFGLIDSRDALLDKQKQVASTTDFAEPKKADELRQEKESFYQQLWPGGVDKDAVESAQVFNEKTSEQQEILDRITTQIANTQNVQKKQELQKVYDGLFQTFERDANEAAQTFQNQDLSQFDQMVKAKDQERLNNVINSIVVEQDPQARQTMYEQLFMQPRIKDAAESASVFATQGEDADIVQRRKELQQTINKISQESDPVVRQKLYDQMFLQPGVKNAQESAKVFESNILTLEQQEADRKQREGDQYYNEVFAQNKQPVNIGAQTENVPQSAEESAKTFEQAGLANGQTSAFTDERQVPLTDQQQIIIDKNNFEIAKLKQSYNTTIDRDERINVLNQIDALEKVNSDIRTPVEQFPQFQTTQQASIGKVGIEDIKKAFPKQKITQAEDGTISVQFKNGKGLTIKSIQQADTDFIKLAIETGQMSKKGKILGITVGNEILLNDNFADNKTLWHENKHVLDNLGLITTDDDAALNREFNKLRKAGKLEFALSTHKDPKQAMIENRANMFAQIMVNRDAYRSTSFGKVIQRVTDFFQQLLSFGKQSVAGLAREVESGKIYERQGGEGINNNGANFIIDNAKAFFSKLQQISTDKFSGMKAQSVEPFLLKQGVKKTEIEATGLREWLAAMKPTDKVTQEQLNDFVRSNTVEFEDVILGDLPKGWTVKEVSNKAYDAIKSFADKKEVRLRINPGDYLSVKEIVFLQRATENKIESESLDKMLEAYEKEILKTKNKKAFEVRDENGSLMAFSGTAEDAINEAKMAAEDLGIVKNTQFNSYQEPGAKEGSYREMFVTAPKMPSLNNDSRKKFGKDYTDLSLEEMQLLKEEPESIPWTDGHSQYSDIKNPIVRIRFNEVTGQNGERILRVEEMQGPSADNQSKMPKHLKDNIYQTGVKRILAYAKENGFDGVALATKPGRTAGETQADRYSLEKQVSKVEAFVVSKGVYNIFADDLSGERVITHREVKESDLPELVGKDLAEKIINQPYNRGEYTGLDLRVGGEGLKQLYDNDLPNIFKAWSKQQMATINGMPYISVANAPNSYPMFITKDSTPEQIAQAVNPAIKYDGKMDGIPNIVEDMHNFTITLPDGKQSSFSVNGDVTIEKLNLQLNKALARFGQATNGNINFQVAEEPKQKITDAEYTRMFNERDNYVSKFGQALRKYGHESIETIDKYFGVVSSRLRKIDPSLPIELRNMDFRIGITITDALKKALPMLHTKMSKEDRYIWDKARIQGDTAKIDQLANKYGITNDLHNVRGVLDKIHSDAKDVGLDIGYIEDYWPRVIKDHRGFLMEAKGISEWPVIEKTIKIAADKLGMSVERYMLDFPEQAADITSNLILGRNVGIGGTGNTKTRMYDTVPPELIKYYMDSDASLMAYIYGMTKKIEARRFFGKVPERISKLKSEGKRLELKVAELQESENNTRNNNPEEAAKINNQIKSLSSDLYSVNEKLDDYRNNDRDYTESIGHYVNNLITNGKISKEQQKTVVDILKARFNEHGTTGLVNAYRNFAYIDVMGSPISAITQIGDLAWAAYVGEVWTPRGFNSNIKNLVKAIFNKSNITKENIGIERIAQEFADSTTLGDAVSWVFRKVGLEKMDRIGKEVLINNAFDKYKSMASTKDSRDKLIEQIKPIFGKETDSVIQDLLTGKPSPNVKMLLYHRLLDFQPVALSEMPAPYLDGGNGRIAYMLKMYTIKQVDVFRNEVYNEIKEGATTGDHAKILNAIGNMTKLLALLTLANAGADELKDLILGKETKFEDHVIDNFLSLGGASKYMKAQIQQEGIGSGIMGQILPPFKFINSASKDIIEFADHTIANDTIKFDHARIVDSLPIAGKLYYWHYGRGEDYKKSNNEKEFGNAGKEVGMFKRQLENADDKRNFMYANIDKFKQMKLHENFQSALSRNQAVINKLKKVPETTNVIERLGKLKEQREILLERYFEASEGLK